MRNLSLSPAFSLALPFALVASLTGCDGKSVDSDTSGSDADTDADADTDTDADSDSDADTDTDTDADCTAVVTSFSPATGATDVGVDTSISAMFSAAAATASVSVTDSSGASVSGSTALAGDGMSVGFVPDDLLARSTTYDVEVSVCDAAYTSSFTTAGESTTVTLDDHTYDIDLTGSDITWISPSDSAGDALTGQLDADHLLIMVQSSGATIDTVAAAGQIHNGALIQYQCAYAIDFPANSFAGNPAFTAGPMDASLSSGSTEVPVYDLQFTGTFATDAGSIRNTEVTGLIDSRPVSDSLGYDICDFLPLYGDECVACPDGEVKCIALDIIDSSSPYDSTVIVDAAIDPSTDSHCN